MPRLFHSTGTTEFDWKRTCSSQLKHLLIHHQLLIISEMSTDQDEEILELSDTLSAKLLQNAEFIETAYECLKTYKQQSMASVLGVDVVLDYS